jgi:hypothetical protein
VRCEGVRCERVRCEGVKGEGERWPEVDQGGEEEEEVWTE